MIVISKKLSGIYNSRSLFSYLMNTNMASKMPSSDMAKFREIYKKSKRVVVLTGKDALNFI